MLDDSPALPQALIQKEFPQDPKLVYLNHAAVGPWPNCTAQAVQTFAKENVFQGARNYPRWEAQEATLREQAQVLINAPASEDIAFLKNTSEALSVVAQGVPWQAGDNIVTTDQEFPSNRVVWEVLRAQGVELRPVTIREVDDPEAAICTACDERTRLITVSSVQYNDGFRLDLAKIGAFCQAENILFCVDAIQSLGALAMDVQAIHADFVMADGHKWLLAPEGLAIFYCRAEVRDTLQLRQYGWRMIDNYLDFGQRDWAPANSARRFECGSPNMLGIHALSASLGFLLHIGIDNVQAQLLANQAFLHDALSELANVRILSPSDPARRSGIVTFHAENKDNYALYRRLMESGVVCASRGGGVRFSPHFYLSQAQLKTAVKQVLLCM